VGPRESGQLGGEEPGPAGVGQASPLRRLP
jgi:hypothetical protein